MKFVGILMVAFVFLWALSEVAQESQAFGFAGYKGCNPNSGRFWRRDCWSGKRDITAGLDGIDDDVSVPEQFQCCVRPRGRRLRGLDGWKGAKVQGVVHGWMKAMRIG